MAHRRPFDEAGLDSRDNSLTDLYESSVKVKEMRRESVETMRMDEEMGAFTATNAESRSVKKKTHLTQFGSPRRVATSSSTGLNAYGMAASVMSIQSVSRVGTTGGANSDRIRVCVRKRPLNKKEVARKETDVAVVSGRRTIQFHEPK
jgi:kinesin family protein 2/24